MKQPKKLTRNQKEKVAKKKLNPKEWMFVEELEGAILIIHKQTKETRWV
jgi:hypothetical protein